MPKEQLNQAPNKYFSLHSTFIKPYSTKIIEKFWSLQALTPQPLKINCLEASPTPLQLH